MPKMPMKKDMPKGTGKMSMHDEMGKAMPKDMGKAKMAGKKK